MFSKLKQFKDVRAKAKTLQSALAKEHAEGSAGWGKVKVTFDGNQQATHVALDSSVMGNKTNLEKLIQDAINDGMQKIHKLMASKLKDMGGLDIAKDVQSLMGK